MNFGSKVRTLRKSLKLSQSELAEKIGVSTRSIAGYEAGTSIPRKPATYEALAEALGVDANYLRTEEIDKPELSDPKGEFDCWKMRQEILQNIRKLFICDEFGFDDQMDFMADVEQLFLDARMWTRKYEKIDESR